jgi:hypothetical protein
MQIHSDELRFDNGLSLRLVLDGERFLGIGEVRARETNLRNPQLPWTLYAESEKGFRFEDFRLQAVVRSNDGGYTLEMAASGRWLPRLQKADAMGDARIATRHLEAPEATFRWTFRPITENIQENTWQGLAMRIEFDCPGQPIHWLIEDTTWEIDGEANGCTLIQQDVSTLQLEQPVRKRSEFSTIEKFFTADGWGGSYPMDMLPRAAGAAICDFQTKSNLAMCLFAERPGLTRARLEKRADENVIHYTDRPFFSLAAKGRAPERKLLVYRHPQRLQRHEWRNLWLDCFTEVRGRIHKSYGFRHEIPQPYVHAHLWDPDLKRLGAAWTEPLSDALPDYARLGYKQVFTHGVWESVTSDDRPYVDGNICSPYAFRFSEKFGGATSIKRLADQAHDLGLALFQWFCFHRSTFAPLWKEHPDWALHEANGDPWDGAYQNLRSGRMRGEYGKQLFEEIRQVKQDTGLDGIFWDSYQNLGVTCVDWQAPDRAPQAEEIWRMQARLQRMGFVQRCEVVTIFGVSSVGLYGFKNDAFRRRLWSDTVNNDEAFALFDCSPAFHTEGGALGPDKITPNDYFWLAAHRAIPPTDAHPWKAETRLPGGEQAEEYARVNHFYNAALPRMHRLRVTPGGNYAMWLDRQNRPAVIWTFADVQIPWNGTVKTADGERVDVAKGGFSAHRGEVYFLRSDKTTNRKSGKKRS